MTRPYRPADIEPLLVLWWESWHSSAGFAHPRPLGAWRSRWISLLETHEVAVFESGARLIGFAALDVRSAVLSQLFVAPAEKRNGVGRALFAWARARCGGRLRLKTLVQNAEARLFYEGLGMVEGARGVNDFNGHAEVEYVLSESR